MEMHNFMPMSSSQEIKDTEDSHFMNGLYLNMNDFWRQRHAELLNEASSTEESSQPSLPLARIRKVMKSDEQVKMISADTLVVFAKASETLVLELTAGAWLHAQANNRATIQRIDILNAINDSYQLFLNHFNPPITQPQQEVARPENLPDNKYQSFFDRLLDQEMQEKASSSSAPPEDDEEDPYLIFKKFLASTNWV